MEIDDVFLDDVMATNSEFTDITLDITSEKFSRKEKGLLETYKDLKNIYPDIYISGSLGLKIQGFDLPRESHDLDVGMTKSIFIPEPEVLQKYELLTSKKKNYQQENVLYFETPEGNHIDLWHDIDPGAILEIKIDDYPVKVCNYKYIIDRKLMIAMMCEPGSPKQSSDVIFLLQTYFNGGVPF